MGIFDTDENGKRLTKKQKDRAKSWAGSIGLFVLINLYKSLWQEGNNLQKARMAISWLLFFVGSYFNSKEKGLDTIDRALRNVRGEEPIGMTILTIWLVFVIVSWYWRYKEPKKSE